jgi:Sulfotransferase family
MAEWLRTHPNIFLCPQKEPYFFNTDDGPPLYTLDQYEALFHDANDEHIVIGEASTFYLSSSKAVMNIMRYKPDARFIVMVRNPVEMAPAYHAEFVLRGAESVKDFVTAWHLQESRRLGRNLPAFYLTQRHFLYGQICSLGAQLEILLRIVPSERVLVIIMDDLFSNPRNEYLRVLKFLGVPDDSRSHFPAYNSARVSRWPNLLRCAYLLVQAKQGLGITGGWGIWSWIMAASQFEQERPALQKDMVTTLKEYFSGDIELLEKLLGRDLRHWLEGADAVKAPRRSGRIGCVRTPSHPPESRQLIAGPAG